MSELSWDNVREGDKIKVKHDQGAVVVGVCDSLPFKGYVKISGLHFVTDRLEILEHTITFKKGDIGVITSHSTGSHFVGIYTDGAFYSSDSSFHTKVHTASSVEGFDVKIVGNIYE